MSQPLQHERCSICGRIYTTADAPRKDVLRWCAFCVAFTVDAVTATTCKADNATFSSRVFLAGCALIALSPQHSHVLSMEQRAEHAWSLANAMLRTQKDVA